MDTINIDLSIFNMCLKGSQVELSVFYLYSFWVIVNVLLSVDLFQIFLFSNNSFRNTIRVSNRLDPDSDQHFGPDLDPNCLKGY